MTESNYDDFWTDEALARGTDEAESDPTIRVIRPELNQLLLDIDTPQQWEQMEKNLPLVTSYFGGGVTDWWYSKSGDGRHVVVTLGRDLLATERIVLQTVLGSDPKRSMLDLIRFLRNMDDVSVLHRPRDAQSMGCLFDPE